MKISKKGDITLIAICVLVVAALCLTGYYIFYRAWTEPHEPMSKDNTPDYYGSDLWEKVLDEFDYIEVKYTPKKSGNEKYESYSPEISLDYSDEEDFISKTNSVWGYIQEYLSANPDCEVNKFDTVRFTFVKSRNYVEVEYSNDYNGQRLDGIKAAVIRDEKGEFFMSSDIKTLAPDAEYIKVFMAIKADADLSVLGELDKAKEVYLEVDKNAVTEIKKRTDEMQLPFKVTVN